MKLFTWYYSKDIRVYYFYVNSKWIIEFNSYYDNKITPGEFSPNSIYVVKNWTFQRIPYGAEDEYLERKPKVMYDEEMQRLFLKIFKDKRIRYMV